MRYLNVKYARYVEEKPIEFSGQFVETINIIESIQRGGEIHMQSRQQFLGNSQWCW